MCGICLYIQVFKKKTPEIEASQSKWLKEYYPRIQHRGPDESSTEDIQLQDGMTCTLGFHRLSIVDPAGGHQPIHMEDKTLMCNGEIFNYMDLDKSSFAGDKIKHIGSDCFSILSYYMSSLEDIEDSCEEDKPMAFISTIRQLDGDFALTMIDYPYLFVARDPVGVRPLFYRIDSDGIQFASEAKAIMGPSTQFPPGFIGILNLEETPLDGSLNSDHMEFHKYTDIIPEYALIPQYGNTISDSEMEFIIRKVNMLLTTAVEKRFMSDRPIAYMLSGGLDSSVIAAIGAKFSDKPIATFSIGLPGSPDLIKAKQVAEFLKSDHTEVHFSVEEGIATLDNVISAFETFDCTTIRAGTPMYILGKYITEKTPYKVIFSGEGADELFGGYLYFHNAPSPEEFQSETHTLLDNLHQYDIIRADRSTSIHGLELRVPFLDKDLVHAISRAHPKFKFSKCVHEYKGDEKSKMEKYIVRRAFEDILPEEVAWRQKEAFSDGVGYSWVDGLKKHANENYSEDFKNASKEFPYVTPLTPEEFMMRRIYTKHFPDPESAKHIQKMWRVNWSEQIDPSATFLSVHSNPRTD